MPPVLDPSKSKVDGLAFIGLSLAQRSEVGHPNSETHQTAFDLNEVIDRDYEFIMSTNDDGWLVGGGEPGPPVSYKLRAKDSAHVELMRIGTYRKEWGGLPKEEFIDVMKSGDILIPQIEVSPTDVVANPDKPPELEIRFDMEPEIPYFGDADAPLPLNWQLRFIHNQLFKKFEFPSRFCPGPFHSTILRKAEFRSDEHRAKYFAKCDSAIKKWKEMGPKPLNLVPRDLDCKPFPIVKKPKSHEHPPHPKPHDAPRAPSPELPNGPRPPTPEILHTASKMPTPEDPEHQEKTEEEGEKEKLNEGEKAELEEEEKPSPDAETTKVEEEPEDCHSGLWLFDDRENITHFFTPNFLPPYNTPEKRKIILDVLKEEWCEKTMSWKPCGEGSMTKKKAPPTVTRELPVTPAEEKTAPVEEEKGTPVEEEKSAPVEEQEEIADQNDLAAKLDNLVGDVLSHVNVCCSKQFGKPVVEVVANKDEETKVA